MIKPFLVTCLCFCSLLSFAQRERGKIVSTPKIFQKKETTTTPPPPTEQEVDFHFEEEPKLRFQTSFETKETKINLPSNAPSNADAVNSVIKIEPVKSLNETIHEDTSSIDEGELMIVEIEEEARFPGSDEMVNIASYFSVWDNRYVDPYGIDPKDFDEIVPIKLYDVNKGRYWSPPLDACPITSHFGYRYRRWHQGTDIDLETGDKVYATFDGIIRISGTQGAFGRCVVIRHYNGLETVYGHMSQLHFPENTIVKAGDEIGKGGNTGRSSGSHLHYETRYEGNAFDAENIFKFERSNTEIYSDELVLSSKMYDYLRGKSSRVNNYNVSTDEAIQPSQELPQEGTEISEEDDFEEEKPVEIVQKVWYRVKPGDNLTKIARNYGTSVNAICRLNKISSYKNLMAGTKIRVK